MNKTLILLQIIHLASHKTNSWEIFTGENALPKLTEYELFLHNSNISKMFRSQYVKWEDKKI